MSYHELLKKCISESGWSMREISKRCGSLGTSVSQVYLSQLSRGEVSPASDKVNKTLGVVLSQVVQMDKDELYFEAYKQKIPRDVIERISMAQ